MKMPNIDKLIHNILENLPTKLRPFGGELEDYLHQTLSSSLKKMDLVTRHEFDIQAAVLQRTRHKLEELEKRVKKLEANFTDK